MTIYNNLKQDHDRLKGLLQSLVLATENNHETKQILVEIENELVPHSRAEEAIFYNTIREETDNSKLKIANSFREHAQAETLLRTLQGLEVIGVEWGRAAAQLKDSIEHHIAEEEGEIFAVAQEIITMEEADQLGQAFEKAKDQFREQGTLKNAMQFVSNMLPSRFADRIRHNLQSAS